MCGRAGVVHGVCPHSSPKRARIAARAVPGRCTMERGNDELLEEELEGTTEGESSWMPGEGGSPVVAVSIQD